MNLQRREEIRAIAECPNDRHWAQEMRRAVAELLAHIDTLEQTAAERVIADGKVPAVVVPISKERIKEISEIFDADPNAGSGCGCEDCVKQRAAAELIQALGSIESISAHRAA